MSDFAMDASMGGEVRLYDIDAEAARKNEIIGNRISAHPEARGKWVYRAVDSLKAALTGADFVILSILPGTFREMQSDVHEPEKFGIWQSVGDTAGPGGLVRALRTLPMYRVIAEAIGQYAPKAWVVNYTNPMAACVRTLYEVFPGIQAFGCCHEVFGTQKLLADMLSDMEGIEDVGRAEIHTDIVGVNHFTWIVKATYKDMDLFPLYARFVEKHYETGYEHGKTGNWMNDSFSSAQRVKFDLFRRYGYIAAAGDRHLAEFCPPWYLKDPATVKAWKFGLTTVSWRIKQQKERMEKSGRLASGAEPVELKASGEEGVALMKALLGMTPVMSNVNLPNRGQIPNLPLGTVVETNAYFSRGRVAPLLAGNAPDGILPLIMPHALNQGLIVKAGLEKDRELAFKAFLNEPLVRIDRDEARELFDTMLENTKQYL